MFRAVKEGDTYLGKINSRWLDGATLGKMTSNRLPPGLGNLLLERRTAASSGSDILFDQSLSLSLRLLAEPVM